MSYCEFAKGHPIHGPYHDNGYGFPIADDNQLFERLVLEINQAGLSWETILKKRDAFREAYAGFDIRRVARFTARDLCASVVKAFTTETQRSQSHGGRIQPMKMVHAVLAARRISAGGVG
jgi:DNA-3-methyladenine glycosylase I